MGHQARHQDERDAGVWLTHDDDTIWSMVAFLQKLPDLTPAQYKDLVAKAPPDEDMDMGEEGDHHGGDGEQLGDEKPQ